MKINGPGLWSVLTIVALVGCGSSGGTGGTGGSNGGGTGSGKGGGTGTGKGGTTGGGAFTTSVPAGTKVTGLTTAQATQLCNDINSYVDNTFLPALCKTPTSYLGLEDAYVDLIENPTASDSELQMVCASDAQDASSCSDSVDAGVESCEGISQVPSTCEATVGDETKCLNDTAAADEQFYAALPSCGTLTGTTLKALFEADGGSGLEPPDPASCSKLESTCQVDGGSAAISNMSRRMTPKRRR